MSGQRYWLVLPLAAVVVTGALAVVTTSVETPGIEAELTGRARAALNAADLPTGVVAFSGRDATVRAASPGQARQAGAVVGRVEGVRTVETKPPSPRAGPTQGDGAPDRVRDSGGDSDRDKSVTKDRLRDELDELLADSPITFLPDTDELTSQGERTVSAVADLFTDVPPDFRFVVEGHVARVPDLDQSDQSDREDAEELSYARAEVVAIQLVEAGVSADRIRPVGYGDTRPRTEDGTSPLDRRVEITVR